MESRSARVVTWLGQSVENSGDRDRDTGCGVASGHANRQRSSLKRETNPGGSLCSWRQPRATAMASISIRMPSGSCAPTVVRAGKGSVKYCL